MLEHIFDQDLFQRVVDMKEQRERNDSVYGGGRERVEVHELNAVENDAIHGQRSSDKRNYGDDDEDDDEPVTDPNILAGIEGTSDDPDTPHLDREYQKIVTSLRENHSPEEVDAILATVERERKEVIEILEREGGDMDDVIAEVRRRTYEEKDRIMAEIHEEMMEREKRKVEERIMEGEIVSKGGEKS